MQLRLCDHLHGILTQLLFLPGCLMHVVCVATGALHLWTQLLLGGGCSMQSNATVELSFDRRKVVMDITFAAWCKVNIRVCGVALCEAVDAMFCL